MFAVAPKAFTKALEKSANNCFLSISKYIIIHCLQSPTEPCLCLAFNLKKNPAVAPQTIQILSFFMMYFLC